MTWTHAKTRLFARIQNPDSVKTGLCVTPELGVELFIRTEEGDIDVTQTDLDKWEVSAVDAAAVAVANLRAVANDDIDWLELPSSPFLYALFSEDGDAASRLLALDELIDVPISGVVVAVPTQGQLICLPLTHYDVLEDLPTLVLGAQLAARANLKALATDLFFFDGSGWSTLSVNDTPGETSILPSLQFARALETLAMQSLAPQAAEA